MGVEVGSDSDSISVWTHSALGSWGQAPEDLFCCLTCPLLCMSPALILRGESRAQRWGWVQGFPSSASQFCLLLAAEGVCGDWVQPWCH